MSQKKQSSLLGFFNKTPNQDKKNTPDSPIADGSPHIASTPVKSSLNVPKTPKSNLQSTPTSFLKSNNSNAPSSFNSDMASSPLKRNAPQSLNKKVKLEEWHWLKSPRDSQRRPPTDPEYDKTTLYIPPSDFEKLTGMEKQFWGIKKNMFDVIVFFQKGKFYELYSKDADMAHNLFGMALANRSSMMRMCGVPTASFDTWATKFTAQGLKIAKVDQAEDDGKLKKRVISQVYTKSTLFELESDPFGSLMLSLFQIENEISLSITDVQSGNIYISIFKLSEYPQILGALLARQDVKEVLLLKSNIAPKLLKFIHGSDPRIDIIYRDANEFGSSLESFELPHLQDELPMSVIPCVCATFHYLTFCHLFHKIKNAFNISQFDPTLLNQFSLDGTTIQHLELFGNNKQEQQYSFFHFIDHTVTPMGKRLLKSWLLHPLISIPDIQDRQLACQDVANNGNLINILNNAFDIPRILIKCHANCIQPSQFVRFLEMMENDWELPINCNSAILTTLPLVNPSIMINKFRDIFDFKLAKSENSFYCTKGFNFELDEINIRIEHEMNEYLRRLPFDAEYIQSNQDYYIIQINRNSKFDKNQFFEFSKTVKLMRIQSEVSKQKSEEYKELQSVKIEILGRINQEIYELLLTFKQDILAWSDYISIIDCLNSFNKCKELMPVSCLPEFATGDPHLEIKDSVHPVMQMTMNCDFISNDISNDGLFILTGANMGGKSTLLRQLTITVIMAQIGLSVPCSQYKGTIVDQIFTRVGARDDMATGQSTFMVELMETSRILKLATKNSLVIMDEFGRGTSSVDGYALAYAVLDYFKRLGCRTWFATHFQIKMDLVKYQYMNYELNPDIVFLYKLVNGQCPRSCGFEVAKLANIPKKVIARAQEVASECIPDAIEE